MTITRLCSFADLTKVHIDSSLTGLTLFAVTRDGSYGHYAHVARLCADGHPINALSACDIAASADWLARTKIYGQPVDSLLWGLTWSYDVLSEATARAIVEIYRASVLLRFSQELDGDAPLADLFAKRLADLKGRYVVLFEDELCETSGDPL